MLCELSIRNFAIIDDLRISFSDGLTVLSGETGAGKSIIINAVNLLLGSRASSKVIRTGAECAELEAFFEIPADSKTSENLTDLGFDPDDGLLIRRIITRTDRHRIYVNGRMGTIQVLNALTENLASISGQYAFQGLLKEDQHLLILDQFGGLMPLRETLRSLYDDMLPEIDSLEALRSRQKRQAELEELLRFQQQEIESACIRPGEDRELEEERRRLRHAQQLQQAAGESIDAIYNARESVLERLTTVSRRLEAAAQIDSRLSHHLKALGEVTYRIEDIHQELRSYLESIETDESRLEWLEARIDTLKKLCRKYGGSLENVLAHSETVRCELSEIGNLSDSIRETEKKLGRLQNNLAQTAELLSGKRKDAAVRFAESVEAELATLKMPQTRFEISLAKLESGNRGSPYLSWQGFQILETGLDQATFMIAPNVGEDLKPLAHIASGGELSRVVLALKAIHAVADSVETIIFDEVDAGIGGDVGDLVGKKLLELSRHHQVICITHMPQIARFAAHHYRIAKCVTDGRTRTVIQQIPEERRVEEIARMLGGSEITRATLEHAQELLRIRQ